MFPKLRSKKLSARELEKLSLGVLLKVAFRQGPNPFAIFEAMPDILAALLSTEESGLLGGKPLLRIRNAN